MLSRTALLRRGTLGRWPVTGPAGAVVRCSLADVGQTLLQAADGAREQAGDVHLRDAELLGDLRLAQPAEVAQGQDPLIPRRQAAKHRTQRLAVDNLLEGGVDGDQGAVDLGLALRALERHRGVGALRFQALQHGLFLQAQGLGERPRRWARSALAALVRAWSSCRRRGTRTAQARSRKCRRISPRMLGVA